MISQIFGEILWSALFPERHYLTSALPHTDSTILKQRQCENDLHPVARHLGRQNTQTALKYYIKSVLELDDQAYQKMLKFYDDQGII